MLLSTALKGMLEARAALQDEQGVSNPTYISEHTQRLAQYTGAVEAVLAEDEAELIEKEAAQFKKYLEEKKSPNMATNLLKFDFAQDRAKVARLSRLVNSSWRIISASQSRVKHMIAEATNQI